MSILILPSIGDEYYAVRPY